MFRFWGKYRSEWYRGLLWAEDRAKGGAALMDIPMHVYDPEDNEPASPWFYEGVADFCQHAKDNNLYPFDYPEEV